MYFIYEGLREIAVIKSEVISLKVTTKTNTKLQKTLLMIVEPTFGFLEMYICSTQYLIIEIHYGALYVIHCLDPLPPFFEAI